MNIIPDKFILLDVDSVVSIEKIKKNLKVDESIVHFKDEEIESLA